MECDFMLFENFQSRVLEKKYDSLACCSETNVIMQLLNDSQTMNLSGSMIRKSKYFCSSQ